MADWMKIYRDAEAYRADAIKHNREMNKHEVSQFMYELMKTIEDDENIKSIY
jgi:hypothetical protein